jgi:hypothetical protein
MPIDKLPLKIDISVDDQKSSSCEIPSWARTAIMKVPAITDGTLTLEMIDPSAITPAKLAADSDTDWGPVYSDEGRTDILGAGLDPAWVNITPYIGGFPQGGHMRIVCTAAQGADKDFMVHFKS